MATIYYGDLTNGKVKFTPEGGLAVKMLNRTGTTSVKGSVVSASASYDDAFTLQSNEFDAIGIVYEAGITDGNYCWVIVSGIAEVLLADSTASTRGNWVICHATDGRADATATTPLPNSTLNEHTTHFKEIGHCIQTVTAGTNKLAKCIIHFN